MANLMTEIKDTALQVVLSPTAFFQGMEKSGGYGRPILFMVVMGVLGGLISIVLNLLGLGAMGVPMAMGSFIFFPLFIVLVAFIVGGVLFLIWRALGSKENYETAFRCYAFMAAITPATVLLDAIPWIGSLLSIAWTLYLVVVASSEVHGVSRKKAWLVFGIIAVVLAVLNIGGRRAANDLESGLQQHSALEQQAHDFVARGW